MTTKFNSLDYDGSVYFNAYEHDMSKAESVMHYQGYIGVEFEPLEGYVARFTLAMCQKWYNEGVRASECDASGEIPF